VASVGRPPQRRRLRGGHRDTPAARAVKAASRRSIAGKLPCRLGLLKRSQGRRHRTRDVNGCASKLGSLVPFHSTACTHDRRSHLLSHPRASSGGHERHLAVRLSVGSPSG
jgi:hypothetical protein